MDQVEHKYIEVNGQKLHVAEAGNGSKTVLFCHGFPEIWYSWRHQMVAVAKAGYRAIAPDYRGYGLSDPPFVPEKTTFVDFADDLHSLLHFLGIPKVKFLLLILSFICCQCIFRFIIGRVKSMNPFN